MIMINNKFHQRLQSVTGNVCGFGRVLYLFQSGVEIINRGAKNGSSALALDFYVFV